MGVSVKAQPVMPAVMPTFLHLFFLFFLRFHCGHPPERGGECRDATEEGEGDDDEEEREEGWHVVAGTPTLPCQSKALLAPGHITHHTATFRVHLETHRHTDTLHTEPVIRSYN